MATFSGSAQDQNTTGTNRSDTINGGAGNDTLVGGRGQDNILGGNGDDTILGGRNDDFLHGGNGNDLVRGGAGDDRVGGGAGDDSLRGGRGRDTLTGGTGNDLLMGDDGDDKLIGSQLTPDGEDLTPEIDTLFGGAGVDTFVLATKDKELYNNFGRDDYALIRDLTSEDFVQLLGSADRYEYKTVGGNAELSLDGDLIAIAKGVDADFFLSRSVFV